MRRGAGAAAVGMSRWQVCNYARDHPEFQLEVDRAEMDACEIVEDALFQKAKTGNMTAIIFWLLNRAPDRWKDRRNIMPQAQPAADLEALKNHIAALLPKKEDKGEEPLDREDAA